MKSFRLLLGTLFLFPFFLQAQHGLLVKTMQEGIWSQQYQPANILSGEYTHFRYGAYGNVWFGNSHAAVKGLLDEGGTITPETKDRILGQLKNDEVIVGGTQLDLLQANIKIGSLPLGIYLGQDLQVTAGFNNPHTFGLIMKGNGPYAGETVSDPRVFGSVYQGWRLGLGTGFSTGKLQIGARLNLLAGTNMIHLSSMYYSLYTSELGTQLAANAGFSLQSSKARTGIQGMGASISLGAKYQVNEKLMLEGAVLDAGATFWNGYDISHQVNLNWEGVFVTSVFADSIPESLEAEVDSLRELIFPDSVEASLTQWTPLSVRAGASYQLSANGTLSALLVYNPFRSGQYTRLPVVSVGYKHTVAQGLNLAANAYFGGSDTFGFGAMAAYRLGIGEDKSLDFCLGGDNLLGAAIPGLGRGVNLFGGIGFNW